MNNYRQNVLRYIDYNVPALVQKAKKKKRTNDTIDQTAEHYLENKSAKNSRAYGVVFGGGRLASIFRFVCDFGVAFPFPFEACRQWARTAQEHR